MRSLKSRTAERKTSRASEKVSKVDLIYFAGFKSALEDWYGHKGIQYIYFNSSFVLKIGYSLGLLAPGPLLLSFRIAVRSRSQWSKQNEARGKYFIFLRQLIFSADLSRQKLDWLIISDFFFIWFALVGAALLTKKKRIKSWKPDVWLKFVQV